MSQDLTREFSRQFGKEHVNPLADLLENLENLDKLGLLHELDHSLVARMRKILDAHPTPPPSEQPNAEDAEAFFKQTEKEWMDVFYKQTAEDQADDFVNKWGLVLNLLERFARHTAAKAVEDERQRLLRLVDERIKDLQGTIEYVKRLGGGYSGSNNKLEELREVRSWLAGEGEKR